MSDWDGTERRKFPHICVYHRELANGMGDIKLFMKRIYCTGWIIAGTAVIVGITMGVYKNKVDYLVEIHRKTTVVENNTKSLLESVAMAGENGRHNPQKN